jgi:imidazoleglycerol-phosphate dehydratase
MIQRAATIERKTKETDIQLSLNVDGSGTADIKTGVPFMDHMLTMVSAHGFLDLTIRAKGDTEIDDHHTVEDLGICLGAAIKEALGNKGGIRRYGQATIPMDEAMATVVLDISNRPFLNYQVAFIERKTGTFDVGLIKEFFRGLVVHAGITMHVLLLTGEDPHHIAEAIFKAFARAFDSAVGIETRRQGDIPSTKGSL